MPTLTTPCCHQAIRYEGEAIESLYLDFTYPGLPHVELIRGGADKTVTLDNLGEYIEAVVDSTVGSGVYAQVMALRAGFEVRPAHNSSSMNGFRKSGWSKGLADEPVWMLRVCRTRLR